MSGTGFQDSRAMTQLASVGQVSAGLCDHLQMSRRYRTIPGWVRTALAEGEHRLVDYKRAVPNDLAKAVAGGANTVAKTDASEPFLILVGVEEVKHRNGLRSGKPVGLRRQ